jgi:hypothetical protein
MELTGWMELTGTKLPCGIAGGDATSLRWPASYDLMPRHLFIALLGLAGLAWADPARAQPAGRFGVTVEAASVWSHRNDVRIPPATGTEFSIVDLIGTGPTGAFRTEVTADVNDRHGFRFVYAPLEVTGSGTPTSTIRFAGGTFAPGVATDAAYKFTSYRGTYRYRIVRGQTWRWQIGFTGFIRDARIALAQPGQTAENTDIGFVPLGYVRADARLAERWTLGLELDGTAAPQGRAFDFSASVNYAPTPRWNVGLGYRTIEGGADVETVYTFAWFNAAVARIGVRF